MAEPQVPLVGVSRVELQEAVVPPLVPAQLQVYVEVLVVTLEALPAVHRLVLGGVVDDPP